MRPRRELIAFGGAIAAVIVVLILVLVLPGHDEAPVEAPLEMSDEFEADAPEEVADEPPSAIGDIDTP